MRICIHPCNFRSSESCASVAFLRRADQESNDRSHRGTFPQPVPSFISNSFILDKMDVRWAFDAMVGPVPPTPVSTDLVQSRVCILPENSLRARRLKQRYLGPLRQSTYKSATVISQLIRSITAATRSSREWRLKVNNLRYYLSEANQGSDLQSYILSLRSPPCFPPASCVLFLLESIMVQCLPSLHHYKVVCHLYFPSAHRRKRSEISPSRTKICQIAALL